MRGGAKRLAALAMPLWACLAGRVLVGERFFDGTWPYLLAAILLAIVVVYKHRGNIRRTLDGTERRIGERVKIEQGGA